MELCVVCTLHWRSNQGVATLCQIGSCGTGYSAFICDNTRGELYQFSSKSWHTFIFSERPAEEESWSALLIWFLRDIRSGKQFCWRLFVQWTWPRKASFSKLPSKFCDISLFLQTLLGKSFVISHGITHFS